MGEAWYDEIDENIFNKETEEDRIYKGAVTMIKDKIENGASFDEACNSVDVENKSLKEIIIDDTLKILIAERHFMQKVSLEQLVEDLKVSLDRVKKTKKNMLKEVL